LGYLVCRRCGARIELSRVETVIDVPPVFLLKCGRCGRASVYTRYDLGDARWPTPEEVVERYKLRLAFELTMFMHGSLQALRSGVYGIRRALEELAELERRRQQPPET
jgi:hypothetical protein